MALILRIVVCASAACACACATQQLMQLQPPAGGFSVSSVIAGGVLQRGERTNVWGDGAKPGADVAVTLHTVPPVNLSTVAATDGAWRLQLPPQAVAWNVALSATR